MAYLARRDLIYDGAFFHITWRCHNHAWFLEEDWAKKLYHSLLLKYKERYGITIYSYCLMDNHPHITGKITTVEGLSIFMQTVNSSFARAINKNKSRCGQVVMDRFKSPVIQTDNDLLKVMTYGDLNALRVGKVPHPNSYQWCSFHYYAYGIPDPLITPAPSYIELGPSEKERQVAYRELVDLIIESEGLAKREYSKIKYIGSPDWVRQRCKEIKEIAQTKRIAYLTRQRRLLQSQNYP